MLLKYVDRVPMRSGPWPASSPCLRTRRKRRAYARHIALPGAMTMSVPSHVVIDAAQAIADEGYSLVHVRRRTAEIRTKPVNRGIVANVQLNAVVAVGDVHGVMLLLAMGHPT
jgi:hypothetical protein